MTAKTRTTFTADMDAIITTNGVNDVTGADVRGELTHLADSALFPEDVSQVVTGVTGTLTTAAHSGNILVTTGSITAPTTAGFNCMVVAGGAHTVTFNGTTSAAMAAGDVMTLFVESGTVIHAVLTAAADKVAFA